MFKYVALIALLAAPAFSYSTGAPKGICYTSDEGTDLYPQHKVKAQTSAAPYTLEGPSSVAAGSSIALVLKGSQNLKGFILQGRVNGKPAGSFQAGANSQAFDCVGTKDTLTHVKLGENIKDIAVKWTAPVDLKGQKVQFVATVAKNGGEFWVKKVTKNVDIN